MRLKSLAPLSLVALATFACGPKAPISAAHSVLGTQAEPWRAVVFQSNAVTIIGQGKPQTSAISNDEGSLTDAWWRWFVRFDQPDNLFVGREDRYLMINVKNGTVQTIEGPSDGQYTFRNPPDDLSYYDNPILFPRFDLDIVTTTLPSVRTLDQSLKWQPRYGSSDGSLILWEAFVRDDRADPGVLEYGLRRYAVTILNAANPMPEVIDLGTRRDYRQFPWCIERAGKNHIILQFPAYEGETPSLYEIKLGATGEWIFQQVRYEGRLLHCYGRPIALRDKVMGLANAVENEMVPAINQGKFIAFEASDGEIVFRELAEPSFVALGDAEIQYLFYNSVVNMRLVAVYFSGSR